MDTHEIRYKCLEMCYRHDHKAEDIIQKAKILEAYIVEEQQRVSAKEDKPSEKKVKKVGNADILS